MVHIVSKAELMYDSGGIIPDIYVFESLPTTKDQRVVWSERDQGYCVIPVRSLRILEERSHTFMDGKIAVKRDLSKP